MIISSWLGEPVFHQRLRAFKISRDGVAPLPLLLGLVLNMSHIRCFFTSPHFLLLLLWAQLTLALPLVSSIAIVLPLISGLDAKIYISLLLLRPGG
jgi:hypothetical protein